MRDRAVGVLEHETVQTELPDGTGGFLGDGLHRTQVHGSAVHLMQELVFGRRRPAAVLADEPLHRVPVRVHLLLGLLVGFCDEAVEVGAHGQSFVAELLIRAFIEVDEGAEAARGAADDGQHQGHLVPGGTHHRLRGAADGHPGLKRGFGRRVELLVLQPRARGAGPGDGSTGAVGFEDVCHEVEFLFEERLVVAQVVAEEREGLGEGSASQGQLRAAVRQRLQRGEAFEYAHRIIRGQHDDRGRELDVVGAGGDVGQQHVGRGHGVVLAVVFADAEDVDADLVGKHCLVDDVADDLAVGEQVAVGIGLDVAEGVEAEFNGVRIDGLGHGFSPEVYGSSIK